MVVSTSPDRRPAIDAARILALLVVVGGHLALAVVDRPDGEVRGANLLALRPEWAWVAALAPMPIFFAAAGWANATTSLDRAAPRLRTLVGLGTVVVAVWSAAVVTAQALTGDPGLVGDGARIASQPLWFLAAYVPLAAAGGVLGRLAVRYPAQAVGGCLLGLAVLDLARFGWGAPEWLAWPGFFLAWGTPWLLGAWWRASRSDERAVGALLLVGAGGTGALLVNWFGYSPALIDAVPGARSNTTPPTLFTALAGAAQVGGLMLGAGLLDRIGHRWRRFWTQAGEAAVGVYLWHLTALALAVALLAVSPVGPPERLGPWWWTTRPLWWALVLGLTGLLVALTAEVRQHLSNSPPMLGAGSQHRGQVAVVFGVAVTTVGAALIGLRGPRTVASAVACTGLLALSWQLLGQSSRRNVRSAIRTEEVRAG